MNLATTDRHAARAGDRTLGVNAIAADVHGGNEVCIGMIDAGPGMLDNAIK
jgi:hypothetical protein